MKYKVQFYPLHSTATHGQLNSILSVYHMCPKQTGAVPRLDKPRSRGTKTSKQAIIPWVSGAEGCWGLVLRKHTGEATDPICQGLKGSQKQWKLITDQRATGMKITCACLVFRCRGNVPKCVSGDGKRGKEKAHIYPTARENKPFRNNVQKAWGSRWTPELSVSTLTRQLTHLLSVLTVWLYL